MHVSDEPRVKQAKKASPSNVKLCLFCKGEIFWCIYFYAIVPDIVTNKRSA